MYKIIALIVSLLIVLATWFMYKLPSAPTCKQFESMTTDQIRDIAIQSEKKAIGDLFFTLGECKVAVSIPILLSYADDKRITHEARFKGMSYRYMAWGAIGKITGRPFNVEQHANDEVFAKAIVDWNSASKK